MKLADQITASERLANPFKRNRLLDALFVIGLFILLIVILEII